jgi:pilus assembly protein CpaB
MGISTIMRKGQIIAAGVAAVFGLGSVGLLATYASRKPEVQLVPQQVNTTNVLVAKTQIELGQIVNRENFRWQEWPATSAAGGYIKSNPGGKDPMQPLIGSVARAPILKDEPITAAKLVKPGDGGVLAAILPAGMRAISTRIKEETAVGKLILPNDHVDVILIQRRRALRGGGEEFISDTLFRNVRVLAIGQIIQAAEGKKGADGATATLELTPRQTELLALANSMGEISLALRSVADMSVANPSTGNGLNGQRGNSIRVLRYGVKSRAYGVN